MCKSIRGTAFYFAASHVTLSFIFLIWFVFDTLISEININLWRCDPPEQKFSEVNPIAHYFNLLFKLLYFTGLCVTGIYIFRGVEREKPTILKFATLAFAILQMVGIVFFAVFFSIQWEAAPDYDRPSALDATNNIQAAQLIGEEILPVPAASPSIPQSTSDLTQNESKCNNMALIINPLNTADEADTAMENVLKDVTPGISENVLVAPNINDTTTTTTAIPPPPPEIVAAAAAITTTAPPPTTTTPRPLVATKTPAEVPLLPCTTPECANARGPPSQPLARKVPHNQLVRLVLQRCFAISNGLFSLAYVIVLAFYMLKL